MKVSRVSLFLFVLIYYYLFLRIFLFPYFYNQYSASGCIYFVIFISLVSLFILLLPKRLFNGNYLEKYNKSYFKLFFNTLIAIRIALSIYLVTLILRDNYFIENNNYLLFIGVFIGSIALGQIKNHSIIDIMTFFNIVGFIFHIIAFFNLIKLDFSILYKIQYKGFDFTLIILILAFLSDLIILIFSNNRKISLSKLNLIIPIIISFILLFLEYYILLLSSGEYVFLNHKYVGFISLSIQKYSIIIGNVGFLYMYLLLVAEIFKYGYLLSSFKYQKKKYNILNYIFILLILIILIVTNISFDIILKYLLGFILCNSFIYFYIIKEEIYAKGLKE